MDAETKLRWSSRKFWTMMLWQAVFTALLTFEVLPVEAFVTLTMMLLGSYFLANAAQHIWEKK